MKNLNVRELELLHARRIRLESERQLQLKLPSSKRNKLREIEKSLTTVKAWITQGK